MLYLALSLQRREFAAQREQLRLQEKEIAHLRIDFTLDRMTTLIYQQLGLYKDGIKRLEFNLSKQNVKEEDIKVIESLPAWVISHLPRTNNHSDTADTTQQANLLEFQLFTIKSSTWHHLQLLNTSLCLCDDLITGAIEEQTEIDGRNRIETESEHLYQLLFTNFNLEITKPYLSSLEKIVQTQPLIDDNLWARNTKSLKSLIESLKDCIERITTKSKYVAPESEPT